MLVELDLGTKSLLVIPALAPRPGHRPEIERALRFIGEHLEEPLTVADVAHFMERQMARSVRRLLVSSSVGGRALDIGEVPTR